MRTEVRLSCAGAAVFAALLLLGCGEDATTGGTGGTDEAAPAPATGETGGAADRVAAPASAGPVSEPTSPAMVRTREVSKFR